MAVVLVSIVFDKYVAVRIADTKTVEDVVAFSAILGECVSVRERNTETVTEVVFSDILDKCIAVGSVESKTLAAISRSVLSDRIVIGEGQIETSAKRFNRTFLHSYSGPVDKFDAGTRTRPRDREAVTVQGHIVYSYSDDALVVLSQNGVLRYDEGTNRLPEDRVRQKNEHAPK